jgi:hypothetical protein
MLLYRHQKLKIANGSFENVSQLKYLGTTVTNQNFIQEEIRRRLNSGAEPSIVASAVEKPKNYKSKGNKLNCSCYRIQVK